MEGAGLLLDLEITLSHLSSNTVATAQTQRRRGFRNRKTEKREFLPRSRLERDLGLWRWVKIRVTM